ncbi:DUF2884 family protein [Thalassotalea sp. PLHSN55]|uniref:DUF2884 family protein n=1 Tax=Thalassotalea sp. PLHSN55 TaxID=3435888 RepID=UPI003F87D4E8
MKIVKFIMLACLLLSQSALANTCDINFQYGVIISPEHVRFLNEGKTYLQINDAKQLFLEGREVELSKAQQQLLANYTQGIQQQVPEIVSIAIESVDIGLKAVNKVIGGLTGENSESHQQIQKKFEDLQWRLRKRFNHTTDNYYIAPQDFDDFDEIFAGQFEEEIEEIIFQSLGTILLAVGEAISNREEGNSEQRANTLDDRMELLGKDLEVEITSRAQALEQKAEQFCQGLIELDSLETELRANIPQLVDFDLIQVKKHNLENKKA